MISRNRVRKTIKHKFDVDDSIAALLTDIIFDNLNKENRECIETEEGFNTLLAMLEELLT